MLLSRPQPRGGSRSQRGLSLVELMVGIAIGLIVVAGATVLLSGQLAENRRLIAETQVQQDLRATADIITRELRRSGSIGVDSFAAARVWTKGSVVDANDNDWGATLTPPAGVADDEVAFNYYPTGPGTDGPFGFRLNSGTGAIETRLRAGGWQELTDRNAVNVVSFEVERLDDAVVRLTCPKACAGNTTSCWPTLRVRSLEVRITAQSRLVPEVVRTHRSRVRVRNDFVEFFDGGTNPKVCPS